MRHFMLATLFSFFLGGVATAQQDRGDAAREPWSGYWWQHKSGGLVEPLRKYDRIFGSQAAHWERREHVSRELPGWFGHCHAWSAASVFEREPDGERNVANVIFRIGDLKGLLSACHAQDIATSYGDRYGDGQGSEDRDDLKPDELWRLLQLYLKQQRIPIVLDLEAGAEIWNYPIYQYRVDYTDSGSGWSDCRLQLLAADNNVDSDFVGTQPALFQYTFRVRFVDGAIQMGSGQWTGASINDHPDFAWYPFIAVAENPELSTDRVAEIVGFTVGGARAEPRDALERIAAAEPRRMLDGIDSAEPHDSSPVETEFSSADVDGGILTDVDDASTGAGDEQPPVARSPDQPNDDDPERIIGDGAGSLTALPLLSSDELVALVLNRTSHFAIDLFLDRGDGGRYRLGEAICLNVQSGESGYLYLFDIGPGGDLRLVFPEPGESNSIRKDTLYKLRRTGGVTQFTARGRGQHDLKAIVTQHPVRLTGFAQAVSGNWKTRSKTGTHSLPVPTAKHVAQRIRLYPSADRRAREQLADGRPGESDATSALRTKLGQFAQDACAYFVLGTGGD